MGHTIVGGNMKIFHKDHGITDAQWKHILYVLGNSGLVGFFILQVDIPKELGTVPCSIYGPVMGDVPVPDSEVQMMKRTEDRPPDRMTNKPQRQVGYVQVIGTYESDPVAMDAETVIYTCYGGPLAPRNPLEPGLSEKDKLDSEKFWSQHALAFG
jgi:hypothetical protein